MKIINFNNAQIDNDLQYNINTFCYFILDYTIYRKSTSIDESLMDILSSFSIDVDILTKDVNYLENDEEYDLNFRYVYESGSLDFLIFYHYKQFHIDVCKFSIRPEKLINVVNSQKEQIF